MRIFGVDPGLRFTGYACLDTARAGNRRDWSAGAALIEAGVIRLNARCTLSARLAELDHDFHELLVRLRPDAAAVEMLFAHYKHPATSIVMGHARGVILLGIARAGIPLIELRPTEVKKSLTGHGHASKDQVQRAIRDVFGLDGLPKPPDVADAMAIALCAATRRSA